MTGRPSTKHVASVIGKLVTSFPAVQYGHPYNHTLERDKMRDKMAAVPRNYHFYDRKMQFSTQEETS